MSAVVSSSPRALIMIYDCYYIVIKKKM